MCGLIKKKRSTDRQRTPSKNKNTPKPKPHITHRKGPSSTVKPLRYMVMVRMPALPPGGSSGGTPPSGAPLYGVWV